MSVVQNQVVTGADEHHVLMWPSELEGYVDRAGGEKNDFFITMGNYLPKDLSSANVNVQLGKGIRERDTGAGAVVGIRTPTGDMTIDTNGNAYAQRQVGTTDPALAAFAAFPHESDYDHLGDMQFIADRTGIRAGGAGTRDGIVYDHTDGNGWDVYTLRTTAGASSADISFALSPVRTLADYSCLSHTGGTNFTFGKRDLADRDTLLETIVCDGTPSSRTNVDMAASACVEDAYTACIGDGRFKVTALGHDFQGNEYAGHATGVTGDSADFWFFDPANKEIFIKTVDACSFTGNHWVFSSALSNVDYTVTITDTQTSQVVAYHNPSGYVAPAILDTNTIFRECGGGNGEGLPPSKFVETTSLPPPATPDISRYVDPSEIGTCTPSDGQLCLLDNRFKVTAIGHDFAGGTYPGHARQATSDSGYFWFFDPSNLEIFGKMIDACTFTGNHWAFTAGLTNVEVVYKVADTQTGDVYVQHNPSGQDFPPSLDTNTGLDACATGTAVSGPKPRVPNAPEGEIVPFIDKITFEANAPPDTNLEAALEKVHDNMIVTTMPDGGTATVPIGLVAARPDFSGRISGAELYGVRAQWGPNGFGSAGGGFLKYPRETVTGATLRLLPSDTGVGYAIMVDDNVSTLDPSAQHEYVRVTFDGKTVTNEPGGIRYVTGFTTDAALADALKEIYNGDTATPQQVQSLMLIPHTTRTMACADTLFTIDCDEYSGSTVALQHDSAEDLQVAGRFKSNAYLDIRQVELYDGISLDQRGYMEDGYFSLSDSANITTRPVAQNYGNFTNSNPGYFAIQVRGNATGGSLFPPNGTTGGFYSSILAVAPADWSLPLLPFE